MNQIPLSDRAAADHPGDDWNSARGSAALGPETVVTGHGQAMRGPDMRMALDELARRFDELAVPAKGRYVI